MSLAIKAENITKVYRLGIINHGTLFRDVQSFIARKKGKPDPHAKIGYSEKGKTSGQFFALKNVSFEISQGDRVGIIGRNGAGKSTLLKILSRITEPTDGTINIRGRVASLLEVGAGFHQELTGRENVFLNGAILGLKKREIARKFDEIVDFSEIGQFIDTPVKRYSSGMYVRLAFAVAAHLESEILLADEVLAVGDAEFQKKCLGKMEDVSLQQGRTVLFVSHNMGSVSALCNRGMYLKEGQLDTILPIDEAIAAYHSVNKVSSYTAEGALQLPAIHRIWFENANGDMIVSHSNGDTIKLCVELESDDDRELELRVVTEDEISRPIWAFTNLMYKLRPIKGPGYRKIEISIDVPKLSSKELSFDIILRKYQSNEEYCQIDNLSLPILDPPEDVGKIKYAHWPIFCNIGYVDRMSK
jgi:lipopolysaccharide transport system ATP-binding protein